MPAPASYARRQFPGAASDTTISSGINNAVTTCTLASPSGWPTGAYTGGILCELYSTTTGATAEKVWATDLTGSTLTIVRAADGTSAASHDAGTGIRPVAGAIDADEANKAAHETVGQISAAGQILVGDGANSMAAVAAGTSGRILVGNGTTLASVAVSGDATLASSGALTIANDAVTAAKIAADAVGSSEIATDAVGTAEIAADAVTASEIAADAVTTAKILDDNVTLAKVAASAKPRWFVGPFAKATIVTGAIGIPDTAGGVTQVPIPEACAVVGLSVAASGARTSGSGSFEVTIDGVGTGLTAAIDGTNTQYNTATQAETADAVSAGQRIGVTFTDSSLALASGTSISAYVLLQAV